MADLSTREPGWYWVRRRGEDKPRPARYCGLSPTGRSTWDDGRSVLDDTAYEEIGPRIYPPGEDSVREELLAALREAAGVLSDCEADAEDRADVLERCRTALARAAS